MPAPTSASPTPEGSSLSFRSQRQEEDTPLGKTQDAGTSQRLVLTNTGHALPRSPRGSQLHRHTHRHTSSLAQLDDIPELANGQLRGGEGGGGGGGAGAGAGGGGDSPKADGAVVYRTLRLVEVEGMVVQMKLLVRMCRWQHALDSIQVCKTRHTIDKT
jgi:hypothetical protein